MSVQTTADEHVDKFSEAISTAYSEIAKLLDRSEWGAGSYDSWKVLNTIRTLQELKDEWGIGDD